MISRAEKTRRQRERRMQTRDHDVPAAGGEKTSRVDLGLALLSLACQPGQPLTQEDIAAWCGCSHTAIFQIERKALHKLRRKFYLIQDPILRELAERRFTAGRTYTFQLA